MNFQIFFKGSTDQPESESTETTEVPSPEPEGDSVETTTQKSDEEGIAEPESNHRICTFIKIKNK